jgi:mono/diheme cytochrome c family protein
MRIRSCVASLWILAGFFCLMSLKGMALVPPAPLEAQADSSKSEPPTSKGAAVGELYQRYCAKCHGKDGTGSPGRQSLPDIPDFTSGSWQAQRNDEQLLTSILEGKGDDMPAFAKKIKQPQARDLVPHVRAFAPTNGKSKKEKQEKSDSSDFEERFSRLQKEMDQLRRQSRELSQSSAKANKPSESSFEKTDPQAPLQRGFPKAAEASAIAELFQKHCVKCHGADGTGSQARDYLPKIPDFTDPAWQARRTDRQIQSSILNGKGKEMPRGQVNDKQAGDLVSYIRNFAANEASSEAEETPP